MGLGNPGERYRDTRHNLGFRVVDAWVEAARTRWLDAPGPSLVAPLEVGDRPGVALKPLTWMNRSGLAVRPLSERFPDLPASRLLLVTDDLDLPLGRLRFRKGGGPGGHNGLRSVIAELGTPDFPRLRLGIGRPENDVADAIVDYVLAPFRPEEEPLVADLLTRAQEAAAYFATEGIESAMNRYNAG